MRDLSETIKKLITYFTELNTATKTLLSVLLVLIAFYFFFLSSPFHFPNNEIIKIKKGSTLNFTTELLHEKEVIKSKFLFKVFTVIFGGQDGVMSGDYFFDGRENLFKVVYRILNAKQGLTPVSITIPEGATVYEASLIFSNALPEFDREEFLKIAESEEKEGYLFPDTYFFLPNTEEEKVIETMSDNFFKKVSTIYDEIDDFDKSLKDIIIMASLIEEEAKDPEARRMISGILWKRIEIGMPLQVDAVFPYIIDKNTFELSLEDLKTDSLYNTYKYKGLPVGPISNPGMDSILAAIEPTPSDYLFYLSDRSGNMHYAEDFEQHKVNKFKYLR